MLLEVGRVARAHGLRGEVVVELVTNRDERVAPGSVLLGPDGPLQVLASSPLPAAGLRSRWIVHFSGLGDRSRAERLRGAVLRAEALADPGALWVHELVGADVVDQTGATVGVVTDVQANPASDLLVLDTGALVPLHFVTSSGPGRVEVDLPPGLLEL